MATEEYQQQEPPNIGSSTTTAPLNEDRYAGLVFKDRYLIDKKLGAGGIGEVYLARDRELHSKLVVVKVLLEESGQDEWFKKKFRQEIEALARIDHPGVVGVLDAGDTPDGKPFLVMQYVKGRTLRSMIRYEGMDFEQVATITRQAARALSAAHDQGVLHCDLKPENIMLQDLGEGEEQVKIVDFGIAKIRDSQVSSGSGDTRVAGTVPYMAPEQIQGKPSTATDIFALGVIAYEMLTGRRPFNPPNQYQALETLRAGARVKPQDLRVDLPSKAQDVVLKALSFEAGERYLRARDFGELLAQALTTDLELPTHASSDEKADLELAHVLFMDIVGYSKLPTDEQTQIVKQLQQIVSGTDTFQRAKANKQLISRSTGDGMALVFFSGPKAPVECAIEISGGLRSQPHIKLRMGVNSGAVYRVTDMNKTIDVAGTGINMAQRVMDCGDDGHILLSKSVADLLGELGEWRSRIHDLGECKVKHGVKVHVYNLCFGEIGNPRAPAKMRKKWKLLLKTAAVVLLLFLAAAAAVWIIGRSKVLENNSTSATTAAAVSSEADRVLSYWLTIQEVHQGKAIRQPRQTAGPEDVNLKDFDVKLNISTAEPGYLYVLNELPGRENDQPRYQVIYPSLTVNQQRKVSIVQIPEAENQWIPPLGNDGMRRLWLVWSDNRVDEIETSGPGYAPPHSFPEAVRSSTGGRLEDPIRNKAIQDILVKYVTAKTNTQRDDVRRQTDVKWKGNTLTYELTLKYS